MNGWVWEGNGLNLNGEVGGDPVGSTDPEGSRTYHPCSIEACKNALSVQSWRLTPDCCLFLALNAQM